MGLTLLVLVLGGLYEFLSAGERAAATARNTFQAQSELRAALDAMVDEIRWAERAKDASGTCVSVLIPQNTPFSATSPYTATFAYDVANDTVLRKTINGDVSGECASLTGAQPVAYNIVKPNGSNGMVVEFFDSTNTLLGLPIADLNAVARVRVTITATRSTSSRELVGDVALRAR